MSPFQPGRGLSLKKVSHPLTYLGRDLSLFLRKQGSLSARKCPHTSRSDGKRLLHPGRCPSTIMVCPSSKQACPSPGRHPPHAGKRPPPRQVPSSSRRCRLTLEVGPSDRKCLWQPHPRRCLSANKVSTQFGRIASSMKVSSLSKDGFSRMDGLKLRAGLRSSRSTTFQHTGLKSERFLLCAHSMRWSRWSADSRESSTVAGYVRPQP